MSKSARWLLIVCLVAGLGGVAYWGFTRVRTARAAEQAREQPPATPSRVSHDAQGQSLVTLTTAEQSRSGIQAEPLHGGELRDEVRAIGVLQDDPSQSFTLRAPLAGTLRAAAGQDWPRVGDTLPDGARVALIQPRFAPVEQIDLSSKLAAAQADVQSATAALVAGRVDFERVRALNAQDKNVSDKVVQDAGATLAADEAKLAAARETVRVIQGALGAATRPAEDGALVVPQGGQVIEAAVRPGEAVEAGQVLLRTARFDSLIAAVSVPPGAAVDPAATTAQVVTTGHEDRPLKVERIDLAPTADPKTLGPTLLLRVDSRGLGLRPGTPVTAILTARATPQHGAVVPGDAVVWHDGKAWVYLRISDTQFARREVATDHPVHDGYFVVSGLRPGEPAVVRGAQQLLSEEFKPALPAGGDND